MLVTQQLTFEPCVLQQFEDIIEDDSVVLSTSDDDESDNDDGTNLPILDANSLTLKDLLHELESRGIHPRGFFADDAKNLQAALEMERKEYLESRRKERSERRQLERSKKNLERRKVLTDIALKEENEELRSNERIKEWFHLIQSKIVPTDCQIEVNDKSARSLARMLWGNRQITSLDLSNLNLSDTSGAYLARSLKNNKSIERLNLGDNHFTVKTCTTMAESLAANNSLKYLSLESNLLTSKEPLQVTKALVDMVKSSKSLKYLSLWRCNIGVEGGRMIVEAMSTNDTLTIVEYGYNAWDYSDIERLQTILVSFVEYGFLFDLYFKIHLRVL